MTVLRVARSGRFHDLLMHQPRRRIVNAALPLEWQWRQVSPFGRTDEVYRQEPLLVSHVGVDERPSSRRRCLGPTGVVMEQPAIVASQQSMGAGAAVRAAELANAARTFNRLCPVDLDAEPLQKLGQRLALLNLTGAVGHGLDSLRRRHQNPIHMPLQPSQAERCLSSEYRFVQASK